MTESNRAEEDLAAELALLPVEEPGADFAERVMARRRATETAPKEERPRARRIAGWSAVVATAAVAVFLFSKKTPVPRVDLPSGSLVATSRETVRLGRRATVVAEPGANLSWDPSGDGVLAMQTQGNVFYRVEPGRFVVRTPVGDVTVEGTSFRVEIIDMKKNWQVVAGAVGGALLVVTVYEGRVLLANPVGEVRVEAGEKGTASAGQLPGKQAAELTTAIEVPAAPEADATREDLLARDSVQRQEIATLRSRLRDLEKHSQPSSVLDGSRATDSDGRPWYSPSEETLKGFVKDCRIRFDAPPLLETAGFQLGPNQAAKMNLNVEEWDAVNRVFGTLQENLEERVRALYLEATGDVRGAETLSAAAMQNEIFNRADETAMVAARKNIAMERAGMAQPPAELGKLTAGERMLRLQIGLGDQSEAAVATALGKDRARELRAKNGGWSMRSEMAGCGQDDDDDDLTK